MFTGCDVWQLWTLPLPVHTVMCDHDTLFSSKPVQFFFSKSVTILNFILYHRWWDLACRWQWHSVECCVITCDHQSLQCWISSWWCRLDCSQWDHRGSWRCWWRWGCCDTNSCWAQLWPSDENWKHMCIHILSISGPLIFDFSIFRLFILSQIRCWLWHVTNVG